MMSASHSGSLPGPSRGRSQGSRPRAFIVAAVTLAGVGLLAPTVSAQAGDPVAAKCREAGDHAACAAAGTAIEVSAPDDALELYTTACTKRPDECFTLIAYAQRMMRRKDGAPRGAWVLEKGCDLKSPLACVTLAVDLEEGEHALPQDAAKALRLYEKACDFGSARACLRGAAMVEDARGARRDPARAQRLRQRAEAASATAAGALPAAASAESACRNGKDAERCLVAAAAVQETDAVKAEELYRLGCAADRAACGLWAFAIDRVRRDDATRGTRILEQGCGEKSVAACLVLTELNHVGLRSFTRNETRASEVVQRACDAGDPGACRSFAARLRAGVGLAADAARADQMAARGASLDDEMDKPTREAPDAVARGASLARLRDAYQRELEFRRSEWRSFVVRAKARSDARAARLAAAEQGQQGTAPPTLVVADGMASKEREVAIRGMAKAMFPPAR